MDQYKALSHSSEYHISKYNELVPLFNETISKLNSLEEETKLHRRIQLDHSKGE